MSDGQFWFVMASLMCALDVLAILIRRNDDRMRRLYWGERDAEAQRNHEEFMASIGGRQ